jgi:hypothetical protein
MKPNLKIIRQWVKALRSGKYKQTVGAMRRKDGKGEVSHCCLGVLCEAVLGLRKSRLEDLGLLTSDMIAKTGLDCDPDIEPGVTAVRANDELKWSFERIATAIEKTYLKPKKKARCP